MSRGAVIIASTLQNSLRETDAAIADTRAALAVVVPALADSEQRRDRLNAERPTHEHPRAEDERNLRLRELADEIDILTYGPRNSWDRHVLRELARSAGLVAPASSPGDPSASLHGVRVLELRLAELQRDRARLVGELASLNASAPPEPVQVVVASTPAPTTAKAAARR